ncbi:MAG: S41 family peptidase, partial [Planctomycetota bacterium]
AFSVWLPAISEDFDRAIDASRETLGVVIDLRGNPGGLGAMAMGFGGHFADRPISLGTMSTRDTSLHFRVNPRRVDRAGRPVEPLDVPLAIIVDEMSASTSEIFAGGMQEAGLARIFGRRTPGAALPATATDLPNGDVLLAAMADFTTPNGVRLEGRGVVPDETIELTPANLAEGDPDLRAAAAWILDQYLMPGEDDAGEPTT